MTTIATDGKTMAADRLVTGDGIKHGEICKLSHPSHGSVIGVAGSAFDHAAFVHWYDNNREEEFKGDDTFEALVLHPDGTVECYNQIGRPIPHTVPACSGSGAAIAYGALDAGAGPVNAVQIAMRRDIYSGGSNVDMMTPRNP